MTEKRYGPLVDSTGSGGRQMDRERRALADFRLDRPPGVVARQYVLDDRQAEAGALLGAAALNIDPVEALGDARDVLFGDAGTVVLDGDIDALFGAASVARDRHRDAPARLAVLAGVLQEVLEDLEKLVAVSRHVERAFDEIALDDDAVLTGKRRQRVDDAVDGLAKIDLGSRLQVGLHLQPRQRQEIVDQAGHAAGLVLHDLQELVA